MNILSSSSSSVSSETVGSEWTVEGWVGEAIRIDTVHEHLVQQCMHLDTLKAAVDKSPSETLTVYELHGGKIKLLCEDLGDDVADIDSPHFFQKLNGLYLALLDHAALNILMEGFFVRRTLSDNNTLYTEGSGYFQQVNQGAIYFGHTKMFSFEGPMMSSLPGGEKIVTFIKGGISDGNSKYILMHETRYAHMKEGQYLNGSCLLVSPASGIKVYTRIIDQRLDTTGVSTVILTNGERISGKLINLAEGGMYLGPESSLYNGQLKDGFPSGKGILVLLSTGQVFEGEFKAGKLHGRGKYVDYLRKEQFHGNFVEGKINGQGFHQAEGKWTYEGNFVDAKYQGTGTFLYEHQGKYSGEFNQGKFEGKGRLYTPDGDFIEGQFKDSLPDGPVVLKNSKGEEFTAKVQDGQLLSDSGIQLNGDIQQQLLEMAKQRDEQKAASNQLTEGKEASNNISNFQSMQERPNPNLRDLQMRGSSSIEIPFCLSGLLLRNNSVHFRTMQSYISGFQKNWYNPLKLIPWYHLKQPRLNVTKLLGCFSTSILCKFSN